MNDTNIWHLKFNFILNLKNKIKNEIIKRKEYKRLYILILLNQKILFYINNYNY